MFNFTIVVFDGTSPTFNLEKLTGSQLVKKFPAFYGNRRFITAFTRARHLSLSWAKSIWSMPPHTTSWESILILSSHLRLGLPSGLFPSRFLTKTPFKPLLFPYVLHAPPTSFFSIWSHQTRSWYYDCYMWHQIFRETSDLRYTVSNVYRHQMGFSSWRWVIFSHSGLWDSVVW